MRGAEGDGPARRGPRRRHGPAARLRRHHVRAGRLPRRRRRHVVTVAISSPSGRARAGADAGVRTVLEVRGSSAVEYASLITSDGWRVLAGSVGAAGTLPEPAALERVARDPGLRW